MLKQRGRHASSGLPKKKVMDALCNAERRRWVVISAAGEPTKAASAASTTEFTLDLSNLYELAQREGISFEPPDLMAELARFNPKVIEAPDEPDEPAGPVAPEVDVAGGAADAAAALKAEAESKAAQLAKIKALIDSNDVKEFIRVRPYVDKDERATELQLQAVDKAYVRSADPADALGQLVTKVEYKGACMDFTGVFKKTDPSDKFHDTFQAFVPSNKRPNPSEYFATVNGGIFPEFISYRDRGVNVVPTDFLKVRKFLDFKPTYEWKQHPSEDRKWVQPTQTDAELTALVNKLQNKKQFRDLGAWKNETSQRAAGSRS